MNEPRRRILVIDDNEAVHADFRKILLVEDPESGAGQDLSAAFLEGDTPAESSGPAELKFELDSAFQGEEGYQMVAKAIEEGAPYAMAFCDMRMPPGWDGLETIVHLWKVDPTLQIVICTAFSDHSWRDLIARLGQTDLLLILKKPFDVVEVRQLAHALERKWTLTRRTANYLQELEGAVQARTQSLRESNERLKDEMVARERIESELRLAQRLEAVGQLAAGIAHEINTPVQYVMDNTRFLQGVFQSYQRVLRNFSELLAEAKQAEILASAVKSVEQASAQEELEELTGDVPKAIEQSLEGLEHMASIVRAMKEFSHPGTDQKDAVDLNHTIETTLTVSRSQWRNVAEVELELGELPPVPANAGELQQVLLNLIVNAAHSIQDVVGSTGEKGRIVIGSRAGEGYVELRIADTGLGIPEALHQKIFEPFFTTKPVGKGTGQGLSLARTIVVDRHGGSLKVESRPGTGATFIIRLPVPSGDAAAARSEKPEQDE